MIIRVEHAKNFTTIANNTLRDSSLSWKARGLLAFFLTHADGYQIRIDNLHRFSDKDGPTSVSSGIRELKERGYASFKKHQDTKTRLWQAGEWIISEEPDKNPTPEKPDPGKTYIRKSLPPENPGLYKKDQNTRIIKREEVAKEKKGFLADDKFDPSDLPAHLSKQPITVKAWAAFVQHRKDKRCPLTKQACVLLFKKMLHRSPKEIAAAVDKAIECGWRGLFFNNVGMVQNGARSQERFRGRPDTDSSILFDPDAARLHELARDLLGEEGIDPMEIERQVDALRAFYNYADKLRYPNGSGGPTEHVPWRKFFDEWLVFLREKQEGFPVRSVYDLRKGGVRWGEYRRRVERFTCSDWTTGKRDKYF